MIFRSGEPAHAWRCFRWCLAWVLGTIGASSGADAAVTLVTNAAHITSVMASAVPGDVLVMRDGVWTNQAIVFRGNGTAANPITLRAQTPGRVILNGSSEVNLSGRHLVVEGLWFRNGTNTSEPVAFRTSSSALATNCTVRHVAITSCNPLNLTTDTKWVSLYGVSNVVEFCFLKDKRNNGTTLVVWTETNRPNHHVIRSNYFGFRLPLGVNGGETIRIGTSVESQFDSRALVEGNFFERCNGEIEIISNKSGENVYRFNTFYECEGALTFRHGKRGRAEGNFFLGNQAPLTGGIRVIDEDHTVINNYFAELGGTGTRSALTLMNGITNSPLNGYYQVKRAVIAFNTFVNCRNNFNLGQADGGGTLAPVDCTIANNIVRSSTGPLVEIRTAPTNFLWEGNLFSGATVGVTNAGVLTNNPLLQLAADGRWRPATNSPAIQAAVGTYTNILTDMDGQARPATTGKDIGADEVVTAPVVRRPLGPADVGPDWLRAVPRQVAASLSPAGYSGTWEALPGIAYQLQFSTNLQQWIDVPPIVTNQSATVVLQDDGSQTGGAPFTRSQRYYRAKVLP